MQYERIDTAMGRHYLIEGKEYPSVTTILAATRPQRDTEALQQWAESVGQEQSEKIRAQAADRGTALHLLVEQHLVGEMIDEAMVEAIGVLPWWRSVQPVVDRLVTVQAMEQTVYHRELCYAGTLDLVAIVSVIDPWEGSSSQRSVLIDWKTSGKQKKREWLGDYPIQLAAYWGALENPDAVVEEGWIVLAHPYGSAQVHRFSIKELKQCWKLWVARVEQYKALCSGHIL
jgi:hypothetical protein